jgi:hypothetical protein
MVQLGMMHEGGMAMQQGPVQYRTMQFGNAQQGGSSSGGCSGGNVQAAEAQAPLSQLRRDGPLEISVSLPEIPHPFGPATGSSAGGSGGGRQRIYISCATQQHK